MENESPKLIQDWFKDNDGDGEFDSGIRNVPYSVIPSTNSYGKIIFTTKPNTILAIIQDLEPAKNWGFIGRYGIPSPKDFAWIRSMVGKGTLLFLGDMDPVDLMVFVSLRENLHPQKVIHLGLNDQFLGMLETESLSPLPCSCAPSERKSIHILKKVFPDLCETIGPRCFQMLEQGYKIELEALLNIRESAKKFISTLCSCG